MSWQVIETAGALSKQKRTVNWLHDTLMVFKSAPFCFSSPLFNNQPIHQGLDSWDQNDSFLNLNDRISKRPFFNIGSKIPHKFANLVLICESLSNQRRPNLTWDLCFALIDKMVLVKNLLQVIDLVIHIHEFGVWSLNLIAITILLIHIRSFIPNSFYFMLFSTCRLLCQSSLFHWTNKSGPLL
jgi:hypothetical protein